VRVSAASWSKVLACSRIGLTSSSIWARAETEKHQPYSFGVAEGLPGRRAEEFRAKLFGVDADASRAPAPAKWLTPHQFGLNTSFGAMGGRTLGLLRGG
jgi:hypothetical protein